MEEYISQILNLAIEYAPKLALAIVTLILGLWAIKLVEKILEKTLIASKTDKTLIPFLKSLTSWILKILLFISVASMVGIATTSFVAVLGAAGLAVGLALQGSLSNFAGGVLLLIFRPYKIGDLIETQGHVGKVKEIQIFNTILTTYQNKTIIIPNSVISSNSITNISGNGTLRVDMEIGISYESDIDKAKEVILNTVAKNENVLKDPQCIVGVNALADSSVNLLVLPWCNTENYWDVYFGLREEIKKALDANNITIPFPQRDVHIINS
ncbi:mechanosensitive ion channel family protein [Halarcobacter anaerophilus]|uniref:Mechanosensitive ion channel protein n=1 Tax=Halarcobacter anaerophilus TaxID=877500 RepID=A0A4Q0XXY7_9BACT|nr:mechanosensitive ion channel domain-containing protein [Halarcobacter anaerophilus]QDF28066.1 small conductance mechanosensitive channel protein [Halarcobacter anaerophilus]RXJ62412.1 mechanosensitive ion channel protein [Halarcobacter anaerophilus]